MGNVAAYDNGALEIYAGRNRIFAQFLAYGIHAHVQVYLDTLTALARITQLLRNQLCRILVHLLYPDAVTVDLCLDIAVSAAAHAHTYRQ